MPSPLQRLAGYIPLISLGILMAIFGILATSYRGPEPPPGFKENVQAAKLETERMNFGELLEQETTYHSSRNGKGYVCSTGTYKSQKGSGEGLWCGQGYKKYFGLKEFNSETIDALHTEMLNLGWTLEGSQSDYDAQKVIALTRKDRSGGFSYYKEDLKSNLSFAQKNSNWQGCDARQLCRLSTQKASQYNAIVAAGASYEVRPDF